MFICSFLSFTGILWGWLSVFGGMILNFFAHALRAPILQAACSLYVPSWVCVCVHFVEVVIRIWGHGLTHALRAPP